MATKRAPAAAPAPALRKDGYPKNWSTEISPRILARDGHRCYNCGLANHRVGYRDGNGAFVQSLLEPADIIPELRQAWPEGEALNFRQLRLWVALLKMEVPVSPYKWFVVKLGVAHLDHDLVDHSDANLLALCAQCHLRYDVAVSAPRAAASRRYGSKRVQSHYPLFT